MLQLHYRFLGVGSCKSSNSAHGLPSCEDQKFNLIAELTPTQMCLRTTFQRKIATSQQDRQINFFWIDA